MKQFSWKFAIGTFLTVGCLDVVLSFMCIAGPDRDWWDWLCGKPLWMINFPGYLLRHHFDDAGGTEIVLLVLGVWVFSAMLWSAAAGYYFGRKSIANQHVEPPPR
jgi:hypothetical protein